jgi:hypothetical protein
VGAFLAEAAGTTRASSPLARCPSTAALPKRSPFRNNRPSFYSPPKIAEDPAFTEHPGCWGDGSKMLHRSHILRTKKSSAGTVHGSEIRGSSCALATSASFKWSIGALGLIGGTGMPPINRIAQIHRGNGAGGAEGVTGAGEAGAGETGGAEGVLEAWGDEWGWRDGE